MADKPLYQIAELEAKMQRIRDAHSELDWKFGSAFDTAADSNAIRQRIKSLRAAIDAFSGTLMRYDINRKDRN